MLDVAYHSPVQITNCNVSTLKNPRKSRHEIHVIPEGIFVFTKWMLFLGGEGGVGICLLNII